MRRQSLQSRVKHARKPRTTIVDAGDPKAANALDRAFTADAPDTKWVTDITYIPTTTGWVYLATVTDLFARKIVGWSIADHMRTELVVAALRDAIESRRPSGGLRHLGGPRLDETLLLHSDRGSQYTSAAFRSMLATLGIRQSMSRVGECYDNAVAESVFGSVKTKWAEHERYADLADARLSLRRYIHWFNTTRRHQANGYLAPTQKEHAYSEQMNNPNKLSQATPAATVAAAGSPASGAPALLGAPQ